MKIVVYDNLFTGQAWAEDDYSRNTLSILRRAS